MHTQPMQAAARRFIPLQDPAHCGSPDLIDHAGHVEGEHVVIVGAHALDLMCALIRRGATEATLLPRGERPDAHMADLVILTSVASVPEAATAIAHARRALTPAGRLVLATASSLTEPRQRDALASQAAGLLRAAGFSAVLVRDVAGRAVLTAELPLFGTLARA